MIRIPHAAMACLALLAISCSAGESLPGPGYNMQIRVQGAQLQKGRLMPVPLAPENPNASPLDPVQPRVTEIAYKQVDVARGERGVGIEGRLSRGAVALRIAGEHDPDHWLIGTKDFDLGAPDELQWSASLSFSPTLGPEKIFRVNLQAVNKAGEPGPIRQVEFALEDTPPPAPLVISLAWDQAVDFDLFVQLPDGQLVGPSSKVLQDPNKEPIAIFSYDSNQQCRIDGHNYEDVVWRQPPIPGRYRVFVDMFSACTAPAGNYWARVFYSGLPWLAQAGTQYAVDTQWPTQPGDAPGELVLEFDLP